MSSAVTTPRTAVLGFPRMGRERELKFALEAFWKGTSTEADLLATAAGLRREHWLLQKAAGIHLIPSNDFSLYDHVLDALVLLGATPTRFAPPTTLASYFAMARNSAEQTAMEMTKWFDTNYHYLVPEWTPDLPFQPDPSRLLAELAEARALGIEPRPVLLGPITLLALGKAAPGFASSRLLPRLTAAYVSVLQALAAAGVHAVQIDEPLLAGDLTPAQADAFRAAYAAFAAVPLALTLTTYFGSLGPNLPLALSLPVAGLHLDLVRAPGALEQVLPSLSPHQHLSLGLVDGRNIWLTRFAHAGQLISQAVTVLGAHRVLVATSCSLLHVPHDLREELHLPPALRPSLRFAEEKLAELRDLATADPAARAANDRDVAARDAAHTAGNPAVRQRLAALTPSHFTRATPYPERAALQQALLQLPLLPTTTIGSFPQTAEVRKQRAALRAGHIDSATYDRFLQDAIEHCLREQEQIGLDVLVHGEFERNDMVEYFAAFLDGFAFTANGWVQSYGSRCVKPPVLFADVARPAPMTVRWSTYAASLTSRPVKGMLTGPVTILQWSFVRDDIPREHTALQIALALRDELDDLQSAGLRILQVDEPALREGLPLRRADWPAYLEWAPRAFRLATSGVRDSTQIHTHMCYSEFGDILPGILALDADVLSVEAARSRMELLDALGATPYPNAIGPGVFDIHSPRVPEAEEMAGLLREALAVLRPGQLWVNPDCGLKTRAWPETRATLRNMVAAARELRALLTQTPVPA